MDLQKIGAYIAGKRKALGLTQRELAEKLGMSDKSVSKWERGVCLPDVSLYQELCGILGITLNEFFAGEDLDVQSLPQRSEENLITVSSDGEGGASDPGASSRRCSVPPCSSPQYWPGR